MLGFVKDSPQSRRYTELANRISEALGFMQAFGLDPRAHPELRTTDFYTSHEALLLGLRAGDDARRFHHRRLVLPPPATCCGSATAPASPITRMWNTAAASRIRSA